MDVVFKKHDFGYLLLSPALCPVANKADEVKCQGFFLFFFNDWLGRRAEPRRRLTQERSILTMTEKKKALIDRYPLCADIGDERTIWGNSKRLSGWLLLRTFWKRPKKGQEQKTICLCPPSDHAFKSISIVSDTCGQLHFLFLMCWVLVSPRLISSQFSYSKTTAAFDRLKVLFWPFTSPIFSTLINR